MTPAAIGIIFDLSKTEVLLVKRKDVPIWVLPGGGIDQNETPQEAVIREVKEETGFQVAIERQCAEYSPINRLATQTFVFVCKIKSGTAQLSNETAGIQFFPITQLPPFFFDLHREWLEECLKEPHLVVRKLTNMTYWRALKYLFSHPIYIIRYLITRFSK